MADTEIFRADGFVNATSLCRLAGRELRHWKRSKDATVTLEFMRALYPEITTHEWAEHSAEYVHPVLASRIAHWCSPECGLVFSMRLLDRERPSSESSEYLREAESRAIDSIKDMSPEAAQTFLDKRYEIELLREERLQRQSKARELLATARANLASERIQEGKRMLDALVGGW